MTKRQPINTGTFTSPSPGALLKRQSLKHRGRRHREMPEETSGVRPNQPVEVTGDPFCSTPFVAALRERGVMLAPLLVQWNYRVPAAVPFAKWLKTKEVLLSDARLQVNENTAGVHYFGTYILQSAGEDVERQPAFDGSAGARAAECQTLWGFSDEASMMHMFEICRGRVERLSIVQNDLLDFVSGLKRQINQVGAKHFSQTVLAAPAAML